MEFGLFLVLQMGSLLRIDMVIEIFIKESGCIGAECVEAERVTFQPVETVQASPDRVMGCVARPEERGNIVNKSTCRIDGFVGCPNVSSMVEGRAGVEEAHPSFDAQGIAIGENGRHIGDVQSASCCKEWVIDLKGAVLMDGVSLPFGPFIKFRGNGLVDASFSLKPSNEAFALGDEADGATEVLRLGRDSTLALQRAR